MKSFTPVRLVLIVAAFTALGTVAFCPEWARSHDLDVWNLPTDQAALTAEKAEFVELDALGEKTLKRLQIKLVITQELVSQKLTLSDAAGQFQALAQDDPRQLALVQTNFPASSIEESCALQALTFVKCHLMSHPEKPSEVLEVLEQQLICAYPHCDETN